MTTYTVHYEIRKGSASSSGTKTVDAETEVTAIRITEDAVGRPNYVFKVKKVEKKI